MRWCVLGVTLGVAVVGATGCTHSARGSGDPELSTFNAKHLAADIKRKSRLDDLGKLVCPENKPMTPGTTFDCVSGQALIHIRVTGYNGDYTWTASYSTG